MGKSVSYIVKQDGISICEKDYGQAVLDDGVYVITRFINFIISCSYLQ